MLNSFTLNIQESLKHAWHSGIGFLRCLAAKVLMENCPNYHLMFCGGPYALSSGGQVRTGLKST